MKVIVKRAGELTVGDRYLNRNGDIVKVSQLPEKQGHDLIWIGTADGTERYLSDSPVEVLV